MFHYDYMNGTSPFSMASATRNGSKGLIYNDNNNNIKINISNNYKNNVNSGSQNNKDNYLKISEIASVV